ncbi:hypothetical protein [Streptantibioticus ferralitis]|uniref:Uncharacterized protein n=1 Tax=Streptantibioticus ferralitis TaxID=236510 RepID=A0ABT5Z6E9_9ACTN|nr:hypothetical protein [Streptantibioticus ferralitis]MDF2259385.1 hypothetical protein [Streptantibioticus ferralitis]
MGRRSRGTSITGAGTAAAPIAARHDTDRLGEGALRAVESRSSRGRPLSRRVDCGQLSPPAVVDVSDGRHRA